MYDLHYLELQQQEAFTYYQTFPDPDFKTKAAATLLEKGLLEGGSGQQ